MIDRGKEWTSISQTAACVMTVFMRYRVYGCLSSCPPLFSVLLSLSSLSVHGPLCLVFDSLCFMRKLSCPEGIDLPDRFDPVVMILSFASATSFSPLQSPRKML